MKRLIPLLLAVVLCEGCSTTYDIFLNNGLKITSHGKPRYDESKGTVYFKNALGQPDSIPIVSVRQIQPQSWKASDDAKTIPYVQ